MNVGVTLREFLLEGFLVAGELGGGGASGCSVGVNAVAAGDCLVRVSSGVGGRLVGVSAITADVGAVVVLVAVPVSASALVAVKAPAVIVLVAAALGVAAVVIALAPAAIPAGAVATVPVLF